MECRTRMREVPSERVARENPISLWWGVFLCIHLLTVTLGLFRAYGAGAIWQLEAQAVVHSSAFAVINNVKWVFGSVGYAWLSWFAFEWARDTKHTSQSTERPFYYSLSCFWALLSVGILLQANGLLPLGLLWIACGGSLCYLCFCRTRDQRE